MREGLISTKGEGLVHACTASSIATAIYEYTNTFHVPIVEEEIYKQAFLCGKIFIGQCSRDIDHTRSWSLTVWNHRRPSVRGACVLLYLSGRSGVSWNLQGSAWGEENSPADNCQREKERYVRQDRSKHSVTFPINKTAIHTNARPCASKILIHSKLWLFCSTIISVFVWGCSWAELIELLSL